MGEAEKRHNNDYLSNQDEEESNENIGRDEEASSNKESQEKKNEDKGNEEEEAGNKPHVVGEAKRFAEKVKEDKKKETNVKATLPAVKLRVKQPSQPKSPTQPTPKIKVKELAPPKIPLEKKKTESTQLATRKSIRKKSGN